MTDIDDHVRTLESIGRALTDRFGDDLLVRIGPMYEPWGRGVTLEVFAANTATAPIEIILGERDAYLQIGDAIDCALVERHPLDDDVASWAIGRTVAAGQRGLELWRDSRRHLWGGQHAARIVGDDFADVSRKRRARLSLSLTTEPWTALASDDVDDPLPCAERDGTAFLVGRDLPGALQRIANRVRQEFGAGVSIVTRMDALGRPRIREVLPTDRRATRMRIKEIGPGSIGVATGIYQYLEYEFEAMADDAVEEWIIAVGRHGLLETTVSRGRLYWFVNGPATPEAIAAAELDRRVAPEPVWHSWAR